MDIHALKDLRNSEFLFQDPEMMLPYNLWMRIASNTLHTIC